MKIEADSFSVSTRASGKLSRIRLVDGRQFAKDRRLQTLFRSCAALFLLSGALPSNLSISFALPGSVRRIIERLYDWEAARLRCIVCPDWTKLDSSAGIRRAHCSEDVVVALSGGHDSLWNLHWAEEQHGPGKVIAVHVEGLCRLVGSDEARWARKQVNTLGLRNEFIKIVNSAQCAGTADMRARDFLLFAILACVAESRCIHRVYVEGYADTKQTEPFSAQEKALVLFHSVLEELAIDIEIVGLNYPGMAKWHDLFRHHGKMLEMVMCCESMAGLKSRRRGKWGREFPKIELYPSQCGYCNKCVSLTTARLACDSAFRADENEGRRFLARVPEIFAARADLIPIPRDYLPFYRRALKNYYVENKGELIARMDSILRD
jgi:hypothetical protein